MISQNWKNIISDIQNGIPVIVVDNEDRENEGDFFVNAHVANKSSIKMMLNEGKGLICTPLSSETATRLNLSKMADVNTANLHTAFTVSVDHKSNTTGISLNDRLTTIQKLSDPTSKSDDFLRPGHIFPLIAHDGGVFSRDGHTEAAIALSRIAGLPDVGVICEILNNEGAVANRDELLELAEKNKLQIVSIENLKKYLAKLIDFEKVDFPSEFGDFYLYNLKINGNEIVVIRSKGDLSKKPLLRIHSECKTGDVFKSKRCDCGDQLKFSLQKIGKENDGLLIYLNQEGRGIGFENKLKAYQLQDQGMDTYEANNALGFEDDLRSYDVVEQICDFFEIENVRLITNNPLKISSMKTLGIGIDEVINTELFMNTHNSKYLMTKINKTNHVFNKTGEFNV